MLSLGSDSDDDDDDDAYDSDALCWQVFTVDEMMPHVSHLPGVISKNLLVRDKKKKGLWLVTAPHGPRCRHKSVGTGAASWRLGRIAPGR